MPRELILLSAYSPPTQHALSLAAEDTAAWLNAWSALWHPAALAGAVGSPKWASPYDYDPPTEGHIYSIPETPAPYLSGDWSDRVRRVGAVEFRSTADRPATLSNLAGALEQIGNDRSAFDWPAERVRPFFGIGLAYAAVETLFDAMEHEHLLDRDAFWNDVQQAVQHPDAATQHLQAAAGKLQTARDTLYPVAIHLLDFALHDAPTSRGTPLNLITTGEALEALSEERRKSLSRSELEICGGTYFDREDELLPVESQLWNLRRGLEATKRLTGFDVQTFASPRGSFHPQSPLLLQQVGLTKALFLSFCDAKLPTHKAAVIQWPAADGKNIEAFTREPLPAEDPNTYFHLAHHLRQTIMEDSAAVLALLHRPDQPAGPWYDDWLAFSELSAALGTWTTVSRFLGDTAVGEYTSPANADEFAIDALEYRAKALNSPPSPAKPGEGRGYKRLRETSAPPPTARRVPHLCGVAPRPRRPLRCRTARPTCRRRRTHRTFRDRRPRTARTPGRGPIGRAVAQPGDRQQARPAAAQPVRVRPPRDA